MFVITLSGRVSRRACCSRSLALFRSMHLFRTFNAVAERVTSRSARMQPALTAASLARVRPARQFKMAAQDANTYVPNCSVFSPNHEPLKSSYLMLCKSFLNSGKIKKHSMTRPVTCASVRRTIDRIKYKGVASKLFEVIEENGKDVLIHKRSAGDEDIIRLIGAEDSFDIIKDAHISMGKHFSSEETLKNTKQHANGKRYNIAKECIDVFLRICPECRSRPQSSKDSKLSFGFHYRVRIDFLEIFITDGDFQYVLIYKDQRTKYVLLRPLVRKDGNEIALEMARIFADFLVPGRIETCISNEITIRAAMEYLKLIWNPLDLVIEYTPPILQHDQSKLLIMRQLRIWMEKNRTTNWAMGCIYVQKEANMVKLSRHAKPIVYSVFGSVSNSDTEAGVQYDYSAVKSHNEARAPKSASAGNTSKPKKPKPSEFTYISDDSDT